MSSGKQLGGSIVVHRATNEMHFL